MSRGDDMKYIVIFLVIFLFGGLGNVQADCIKNQSGEIVCGKGECTTDQYGKVFCAQAGGGALRDLYGNVQCGVGGCAKDSYGTVWCSSEPGGSSLMDSYGKVKCLEECVKGSNLYCE